MNPVPGFQSGGGPPRPGQCGAGPQLTGPTLHLAVFVDRVEKDERMRVLKFEFGHRTVKADGLRIIKPYRKRIRVDRPC